MSDRCKIHRGCGCGISNRMNVRGIADIKDTDVNRNRDTYRRRDTSDFRHWADSDTSDRIRGTSDHFDRRCGCGRRRGTSDDFGRVLGTDDFDRRRYDGCGRLLGTSDFNRGNRRGRRNRGIRNSCLCRLLRGKCRRTSS